MNASRPGSLRGVPRAPTTSMPSDVHPEPGQRRHVVQRLLQVERRGGARREVGQRRPRPPPRPSRLETRPAHHRGQLGPAVEPGVGEPDPDRGVVHAPGRRGCSTVPATCSVVPTVALGASGAVTASRTRSLAARRGDRSARRATRDRADGGDQQCDQAGRSGATHPPDRLARAQLTRCPPAGPAAVSASRRSPAYASRSVQLGQRHPGHLVDLDVVVAELAAGGLEQVVVHGLVDPAVLGDEPVVDGAERGEHPAADAGLLLDLADRGVLGGLAGLDVALGQRPEQPAPPVAAGRSAPPAGAPAVRSTTSPPAEVSSTLRSPRARAAGWRAGAAGRGAGTRAIRRS